jgi:RHS repeat-associated protein
LNRLKTVTLNGTQTLSVTYDAAGDILSKSDVGSYTYGDSLHPHAVTAAGSGTIGYDANGNMNSRAGGAITSYSYNLPNQINYNGNTDQFYYNFNHQRWKQVANYSGTPETVHYVGGLLEVMTRGTVTEYRHQIPAGTSSAIYTRRTDGTSSTYYATSDHLGSADLVLDSSGNVLARESFTPFGARRGSNWQSVPSAGDNSVFASTTRKGFTGHEMLDAVGLVHMNGRVYDPNLGRFLSADTVIQSLGTTQSVNSYSYAWNDPLRYTDPSGHSLLGEIIGLIVTVVIIEFAPYLGLPAVSVEGGTGAGTLGVAGFVGGFVGAAVSTGNLAAAFESGVLGAITAGMFYAAGSWVLQDVSPGWQLAAGTIAHAAVGCASAAISSGNCGKGALSAAIAEAADASNLSIKFPSLGQWSAVPEAAEAGLIGGAAARAVGGKFDDGFSVAAAGYLFNDLAHKQPKPLCVSSSGYLTADDAAEAAFTMASTYKDSRYLEYGGAIFQDDAGYEFSLFRGASSNVDFTLHSGITDWWHTHPSDFNQSLDNENAWLSSGDIKLTRTIDSLVYFPVGAYLLTPSQSLRYFPDPVVYPRIFRALPFKN